MSHQIVDSKEPIRLFKSDFLEFFTHINPLVVLIIWAPVSLYFLIRAVVDYSAGALPTRPAGWAYIPFGVLAGLFLWTFTEYMLHRFLFHHKAKTPAQERIFFLFHGVHHAQPMSKTRLVMPPVVSIPLALIFYGLFTLVFAVLLGIGHWVAPTFAGFVAGYLAYDMLHYSMHHFRMSKGYWRFLKIHHMNHHFKTPDQRFGVSSPVWDKVFGTLPAA
jgi:sterol desaturase/sphingolipid hydroxylase (fatty acid hydroxylase superfamily)